MENIMPIFRQIKKRIVIDKGFPLGRTNLYFDCPLLRENYVIYGQYTHSFCMDGFTICVTEQIGVLAPGQIAGILWHEFGKLISGSQDDHKADNIIYKYFRVRICYDNSLHLWYV